MGALISYRAGFAIVDHLAKSDRSNLSWPASLSDAYEKQRAQGDLTSAMKSYRDSIAMREPAAKTYNGQYGDLIALYHKVGDVQVASRDFAGALTSYRDSFAIADRLMKSDPGAASLQYHLSKTSQPFSLLATAFQYGWQNEGTAVDQSR
jgi:hypothetical protein